MPEFSKIISAASRAYPTCGMQGLAADLPGVAMCVGCTIEPAYDEPPCLRATKQGYDGAQMIYLIALLAGLLMAAIGAVLGLAFGSVLAGVFGISSFEGAAGYLPCRSRSWPASSASSPASCWRCGSRAASRLLRTRRPHRHRPCHHRGDRDRRRADPSRDHRAFLRRPSDHGIRNPPARRHARARAQGDRLRDAGRLATERRPVQGRMDAARGRSRGARGPGAALYPHVVAHSGGHPARPAETPVPARLVGDAESHHGLRRLAARELPRRHEAGQPAAAARTRTRLSKSASRCRTGQIHD